VKEKSRDITKSEAYDQRHKRLLVDLTGCRLGRVTTGGQHVIRHTGSLGSANVDILYLGDTVKVDQN
jgi:hypothetical protein